MAQERLRAGVLFDVASIDGLLTGAGSASSADSAVWRVLLVDGDPDSNRSMCDLLTLHGIEIEGFTGAEPALARVGALQPDLVILDLELPGLTGFEAASAMRRDPATARIPILVVSARDDARSRVAAFASGADCFLSKPFRADELRAAVASLAGRGRNLTDTEPGHAVVAALAQVVAAQWGDGRLHVRRSALLARRFGELLGLAAPTCLALERAGWLHDIGKVGVPASILNKPGPLTTEEREVMQQHPLVGARICERLMTLQPVVPVILHHHEWFDGSGYPYGLRGETIPYLARVFQVADVFEALTSERCYKAALSRGEALAVLGAETEAGKWDPVLVGHFRGFEQAGLLDVLPAPPGTRAVTGS